MRKELPDVRGLLIYFALRAREESFVLYELLKNFLKLASGDAVEMFIFLMLKI